MAIIDLTGGSNDENIINMATIQEEGIDLAQMVLNKHNYVMISDDVGLGKTYEGLGIAFKLLINLENQNKKNCEKKFGKILIVAPNSSVANKWIREINDFKNNCLKERINVKINDKYIENPLNLVEEKNINNQHTISVIRANRFSFIDNQNTENESNGNEDCNTNIKKSFINKLEIENKKLPNFDLAIIDESQNLRLKTSKKVAYFNAFFGLFRFGKQEKTEIKFKKTVFLTATPNHSNKMDIVEQIGFVKENIDLNKIKVISARNEFDEETELYIIRRIRTYNEKNKYFYRNFEAQKTNEMNFLERLTMSAIQKRQISENRVIKMGYLDGFEGFLKKEYLKKGISENTYDESRNMDDLGKEDEETYKIDGLYNSLKSYTNTPNCNIKLNEILSHPKVRKIEELLKKYYEKENKKNNIDKNLIFVRRKSSIDEIKKVYFKVFDKEISQMVLEILKYHNVAYQLRDINTIIAKLEVMYNKNKGADEDIEDIEESSINNDELEEIDELDNSIWLENFKRRRDSKEQTFLFNAKRDFSTFYRFDDLWEENIFKELGLKLNKIETNQNDGLFFYYSDKRVLITKDRLLELICKEKVSFSQKGSNYDIKRNDWKKIINLAILEELVRQNQIRECVKNEYEAFYFESECEKKKAEKELKKNNVNINFSTIKKYYSLNNYSFWDLKELKTNLKSFDDANNIIEGEFIEREIKKEIIKNNVLNSEGIIYLITIVSVSSKSNLSVSDIFEKIEKDQNSNLKKRMMNRIIKFLQNYEIENKILGFKNLDSNSEDFLKFKKMRKYYSLPIAGCSSQEKNVDRAQKFFNTSFYPDVMVTTDILKEGIDLQVFCSRIIHYGIAWLPGDMEQRIGRIDRYFCNTYRELCNNPNKKIDIIFIYMDDLMDKKQISKIISNMITSIVEIDKNFTSETFELYSDKKCDLSEELDTVNENIERINTIMKGGY